MQVVQYLVTIILFFAIILTFYGMSEASRSYKKNVDPDYFKNVLNIPLVLDSTWNEVKDIKQLPSVDKKAAYCIAKATIPIKEDSIMYSGIIYRESDSINFYSWFVAEAEYFPMFRHEITEKPDSGDACRTMPVFASKEDVDSLKHLLSLNYSTSNEETLLPDGNKYVKIGYTDDNKIWQNSHSGQNFYIIKDVDKYSPHGENVKACVNILQCWMYIIPKNNDNERFSKEYDDLLHKRIPTSNDIHYPVATVYDLEFKTHQNVNLITEFLSILTAVSILCIILTVYSSISLETRGKQKEVAIRKVNGAKTRDIVMLFSRYYIITLCTAFALSLLIGATLIIVISIIVNEWPGWTSETTRVLTICSLESMATITLVTLLTVWQKIYKISHINPALLIKKE
jgi:ABC-type antimicrobial peptide transport system permease subunit